MLTLDPARPRAEALAVRAGRVLAVGSWAELRELAGPETRVLDAQGGLAVPAFHDAHLHLLSYARSLSSVDCRGVRSLGHLRALLAEAARALPPGAWLRAHGYDEALLAERRHPDRRDLDAAVPDRPVRLRHRGLHLEVLNTRALELAGLLACSAPAVERDPASGEPTGRLYHAAELLRGRLPRPTEAELARALRAACERLLAWGVTSVQDASATNGRQEWELFHRLAERGNLPLRLFFLPGARRWRELAACRPPSELLRLGPVKVMLNEPSLDQAEARALVAEARAAGHAVAIHATTEAELAVALDALRAAGPRPARQPSESWPAWPPQASRGPDADAPPPPDRVEHGGVIPDDWLPDLRALGVAVVGQPALVHLRGDAYRAEFPPELHGWLHRARSLLAAGLLYAASSDAPVTEPNPRLGLFAARTRRAASGAVLGPGERLDPLRALVAFTLGPALAVGVGHQLGRLCPGLLADIAVLDDDWLEAATVPPARQVRMTILAGQVVWDRAAGPPAIRPEPGGQADGAEPAGRQNPPPALPQHRPR